MDEFSTTSDNGAALTLNQADAPSLANRSNNTIAAGARTPATANRTATSP
jgi:hypothetical protein